MWRFCCLAVRASGAERSHHPGNDSDQLAAAVDVWTQLVPEASMGYLPDGLSLGGGLPLLGHGVQLRRQEGAPACNHVHFMSPELLWTCLLVSVTSVGCTSSILHISE